MSFVIQVYNEGQTYEEYCENRGLWFTFTHPNFTYNQNTMQCGKCVAKNCMKM